MQLIETNLTSEAVRTLQYIENVLIRKYPTNNVGVEYFLLAALENSETVAFKMLDSIDKKATQTMTEWFRKFIKENSKKTDKNITFSDTFNKCIHKNGRLVSTGHILIEIIDADKTIKKEFDMVGLKYESVKGKLKEYFNESNIQPSTNSQQQKKNPSQRANGVVEQFLLDLNSLASRGQIDELIGNRDTIGEIFSVLSKRNKNNVIVVGEPGNGKTNTVEYIAKLIVDEDVPKEFLGKKLMKMDFTKLLAGSALRGSFEEKYDAIVTDAAKRGGYIFFIDDLGSVLNDKSKFGEVNIDAMLDAILMEKRIQFISTSTEKEYSSMMASHPQLKRRLQKVKIKDKTNEEIAEIVNKAKVRYESFHNVSFTDDAISSCISLVRQYMKSYGIIDKTLDILDEAGAIASLMKTEDERIIKLEEQIAAIKAELGRISSGNDESEYDKFDELKKEELELQSELKKLVKDNTINESPTVIGENEIRALISKKTNVPVSRLTDNERDRLKGLSDRLKGEIIGQDEAVDAVCRVVKRQRVGLGKENKPSVLFFAGSTGVGKTYLAKRLAAEVYGDENSIVRLDMSEYSDKMSVSKLYGSSPGYVAYENGGILTEAVKKNGHCVVLLDEVEKANEDVHNVFLQMFDEGRMTDNRGIVVDFSNVTVIMTSNVGATEISTRGKGIGFIQNEKFTNDIISKAMKGKFKPEFINRIDSIIYFNELSDENLKQIFRLELNKVKKRLKKNDYGLSDDFFNDETINKLYQKIDKNEKNGARQIIRIIQNNVEDPIADYLIENELKKGSVIPISAIAI